MFLFCVGGLAARPVVTAQAICHQRSQLVPPDGVTGHVAGFALPVRQHSEPVTELRGKDSGTGVTPAAAQLRRQLSLGRIVRVPGRVAARFLDHQDHVVHADDAR